MERLRVYPASYSKYPYPSTRNRKRQNYYPWICRRLNSSIWCCTISSINLRRGCIYKTLVQQILCCTGETNHYPSFGIVCLCVIVTAPGKGFTFLDATYTEIMLWTDSNIVLAWIQRSPEQLKTFIGNIIKIIQRLTQNCQWNHVSSNENQADLISRGLNASDIFSKQLWWHGSDFLREELEANPIDFERITSDSDYLKELKPANVLLTSCTCSLIDDLSKSSNNYTKLLHILSYIFRFLHNSRNPSVKRSGQLDYSEVNEAELCLIKNIQASAFQEEIEFLAKSSCKSKKASKAVHLEIVSDSTTDAFLATLKRFVARRGKCATISSDNAKNFAGANRELKRLHNLLKFPEEKLSSYLSSEGISWNFMPPRAPNFGGLWEAGVKSFKFYLKKAVGNLKMTLEEFLTIITQIEGILNSRPITPLSEDIDDLEVPFLNWKTHYFHF
ncbi:uncharacterized protein TNCV_3121151 [Trichonephila clavipes]|nr:uncharacterized protein TNCV_3121151 [Trichonephila clavipes]